MQVVTIYNAFQGEVNKYGIGARCTFLRLAGCNLRCYKSTGGCDTPEGLSTDYKVCREMSLESIYRAVSNLGNEIICLTGGEPLLHNIRELIEFLHSRNEYFKFSIETNGTMPLVPFDKKYNVSYVVDYKLGSTEIDPKLFREENLPMLDKGEGFIKFVVDTEADLQETLRIYQSKIAFYNQIKTGIGLKWGSELSYEELISFLPKFKGEGIFLNVQAHKLETMYDVMKEDVDKINLSVYR